MSGNSLPTKDFNIKARPVPRRNAENNDEEGPAPSRAVDEKTRGRDHVHDRVD
jgi:hypothetical protein